MAGGGNPVCWEHGWGYNEIGWDSLIAPTGWQRVATSGDSQDFATVNA